jgi:hypothetical protein
MKNQQHIITKQVKVIMAFTCLVLTLLSGCKPMLDCGCVGPPLTGAEFFYPSIGKSNVYEVTETQYTLTTTPITKTYQLKELAASVFQDTDGNQAIRIERYRRENDSQNWEIDSVFTAKKTVDKALKTENNVTYVKMIFPVKDGVKWDGNIYNNLPYDTYEMKNVRKPFSDYPSTMTVVQQNDSTLVDLKKRIEVYAEGVGMIYQEKTNVSYCNTGDCLGKGKIDFGTKQVLKIKKI